MAPPINLERLETMNMPELRAEWRRLHRTLAPDMSADLLARGMAWTLQARAHGGLPSAVERALTRLANVYAADGDLGLAPDIALKPDTRLVRQWGGKTHHVFVVDEGFRFEDRHYASLSHIARDITGAHWSGPRFFRIGRRGRAFAGVAA